MQQSFKTRQFRAGNSQAVRLPADMAFPPHTELLVIREGDKIIVQPIEKTMENIPDLLFALKEIQLSEEMTRPEFVQAERGWVKK